MSTPPQDITEAELEVLRTLWADGARTIRQITDALYEDGTTSQYATVQKLLERLEAKGLVERHRVGRAHEFTATVARDDVVTRRLRKLSEDLCDGSLSPLITSLARVKTLTASERAELRSLLDELDRKSRRSRRGKKR